VGVARHGADGRVMLPLDHARVVRMLGVCTLQEPALIIEEFMANGNLQTFLAKVCVGSGRGASGCPCSVFGHPLHIDTAGTAISGVAAASNGAAAGAVHGGHC
jgi:hypothetical protein